MGLPREPWFGFEHEGLVRRRLKNSHDRLVTTPLWSLPKPISSSLCMLSGGVGFAAARQGKLVLALPPNREIPRPTRGHPVC
jgi:hypothetical protein